MDMERKSDILQFLFEKNRENVGYSLCGVGASKRMKSYLKTQGSETMFLLQDIDVDEQTSRLKRLFDSSFDILREKQNSFIGTIEAVKVAGQAKELLRLLELEPEVKDHYDQKMNELEHKIQKRVYTSHVIDLPRGVR